MTEQSSEELKLAEILVVALDLEDIEANEIVPDAPFFGVDDSNSLGLDSIDALEISLAISQHYGVKLKADDENNKSIFASLRSLSDFIRANS